MTTDIDFMKFMEDEYGAKFVDTKVEDGEKPKEPPPLPQAWVGMFDGWKRDAKYYEKCIKDIRDGMKKLVEIDANREMKIIFMEGMLSNILSHEYIVDGVDLDKPNYGMF